MLRSALMLLLAVAASFATNALAQEPPSTEEFARLPNMQMLRISPDGRALAYVSWQNGERYLIVQDLETGALRGASITSINPQELAWGSQRYLLLSASSAEDISNVRGTVDFSAILSFDLEDNFASEQLLQNSNRTGLNFSLGEMLGMDREREEVFIPVRDRVDRFDLLAVDMDGLGTRVIGAGTDTTRDWVVNDQGLPVARVDFSTAQFRQRLMGPGPNNSWEPVWIEDDVDQPIFSAVGALPGGEIAVSMIPTQPNGRSTRRLYAMSMETGQTTGTLFAHATYDLSRVLTDPYTSFVVGVAYEDVFTQRVWFDEELAGVQAALEATFNTMSVQLLSWSEDRTKFVIRVENEAQSPVYYLYDAAVPSANILGAAWPRLAAANLASRVHIEYPARDGTRIPAYLTLPEGEGPHPTVILPHGGPRSQSTGGYDFLAHFLASRGYAVLDPNFRGSDGYGAEWWTSAYGAWGTGIIQHDVTDGVEALISAGYADPERICIAGWSYGGYAALAGAAFTPDLYQCAISIAGVSDMPAFLSYARDRYGRNSTTYRSWREQFFGGDGDGDPGDLSAQSPRQNAEHISIPVLLIHGENDGIVPDSQSEAMYRALRNRPAGARYVNLEGGGHSLLEDEAMRIQLLTEIETFLDEHIGD